MNDELMHAGWTRIESRTRNMGQKRKGHHIDQGMSLGLLVVGSRAWSNAYSSTMPMPLSYGAAGILLELTAEDRLYCGPGALAIRHASL